MILIFSVPKSQNSNEKKNNVSNHGDTKNLTRER